ncbi:protrudin [Aplochiton taeniatus]
MLPGAGVSQEPTQGALDRGELGQPSPKETPGSPDPSELGSPRSTPTFDLLNMVVSYKRMALFLEPITDSVELARFLLGWKMPLCSLLVCVLLNILFLTVSEVGWFSVCVLGVSAPAALCYLQDRCGGGASEADLKKSRYYAVHRRDLQNVEVTKQEAMMEVKDLLKQLDDLLSYACQFSESIYKVLYWESHSKSARFYGAVLAGTWLLFSVPVGWGLAALNSALFLWNREFYRVMLDLRELFQQGNSQYPEGETDHTEPDHTGQLDRTPTPSSLEDLSPGSVEEAEEAEPDDEFKDAIEDDDDVSTGTPDYDTISDNGLLSRNEPIRSKVSKLTEKLRKRYPTTNTGNCSTCSAVFSVLKKRRSCSNCGNSFCSRCCAFKVLKSSMGATAPEAQRETVFVCASCNSSLNNAL